MNASIEDVEKTLVMPEQGYPEPVSFSDQYSFFCMAFSHNVNRETVNTEKIDISNALSGAGWKVHPSLENIPSTKQFSIFTPQVDSSFYGRTSSDAYPELHDFIGVRLDSSKGEVNEGKEGSAETIFLRKIIETDYSFVDIENNQYEFHLHWLDLWLFNDGTGLISFKANLNGSCDITRLAIFHRLLRDSHADVIVKHNENEDALWKDILLQQGLANGACLGVSEAKVASFFDPYQRNAKVLMAAQLETALSDEHALAWGRPLMDPPILLNSGHKQLVAEGNWDTTLNSARASVTAGYATVRDMLLFELATVSNEGASLGWNKDRSFQYSAEYVRQMIDGQFVEVWEHWNALMLRDSCVMLSFDPSMPLVVNKHHPKQTGQAEDRYYPLYILTYHLRYSLDRVSEELIDSNLSDAMKSRELRETFIRFRNQYWFHEVTTDFLGREVYEKMKLGIGVDPAYEAVKDEVDMVNAYIREKWAAYTAGIIAVWSVISTISGLENGWWYILIIVLTALAFLAAIYKKVSCAIEFRDWGIRKCKKLYQDFLSLDLMR